MPMGFPPDLTRAELADKADVSKGSSLVGWLSAAVGAVGRWLAEKLADQVSVKDFGTVGDGVASDQAAIAAAVAHCVASGDWLYWPKGTYLTTASIASFHSVRHFGPGVVKRGTDLFYVAPRNGVINTLYVDPAGLDTNDGLSAAQPFLTTQAAGDKIYGYMHGDATWKLQHAAGTLTQVASFNKPFPTPNRVHFLGAAVADGVVPTTIFDSPGGAAKIGLYFSNYIRAQVEDIKFTDYRDAGAVSVSGNSAGITADVSCEIYTRNVHAAACDTGIENNSAGKLRVQAGVINACAQGVRCMFGTTFTVGYNGTAADATGATGVAITNCTGSAIMAQEGATGHADFCHIDGNNVGINLESRSRAHVKGCTISNNTAGVESSSGCDWYNNPITVNTFAGNTTDTLSYAYSVETATEGGLFGMGLYHIRDTATYSTQSTVPVVVLSQAIPARSLRARGAGFKLRLWGNVTGVAGTKTITVTLGGTTLITKTIAAASTSWSCDVEFITRTGSGAPQQKVLTTFIEDVTAPDLAVNSAVALDLSAAQTLEISHSVANAADTSRIQHIEMRVTH